MKDERRVVSPWNIANILTVLRLALVPFFVVCLFLPGAGWRVAALAVFAVASSPTTSTASWPAGTA